jgi:hypothetical protein
MAANSNLVQEQEAVRRLVKSPPELWTQCSDPSSLARHLSGFGEIKITRLEPESTVVWEGESASGTVHLEVSGWGTRVRLTAGPSQPQPTPTATATEPQAIDDEPPPEPRGLITRISALRRRRREVPGLTPAEAPVAVGGEPAGDTSFLTELEAALDSLGQAHHRPYSRT